MSVFTHEAFAEHEQVVFVSDDKTGLKGIIAAINVTTMRAPEQPIG